MQTNIELDQKLINDQPTEPTITLQLKVNDVNLVLTALQELPHRVVDGLLKEIITQAQSQVSNK